ncbi:MAG: AAA family ATPase [Gammaproteobacteria bacterium]
MYLKQFGLAQYPFSLTPNTHYFLKLASHQQAFTEILTALQGQAGYSKVTGEVGTGKTMLCRKLLNSLEHYPDKFVTAYIPHPILSEEGVMRAVAEELALDHSAKSSYRELLQLISAQLVTIGKNCKRLVLLIDEAQAMPEETLDALHLLTEVQSGKRRPLHVVLFGQPELDELLAQSRLERVRDNLGCSFVLPAMDRDDVEAYLQHRLVKAGYSGPHMFTADAIDKLYEASKGVPRLVNVLSHKALMVAYGKGAATIEEAFVTAAIDDTESMQKPGRLKRLFS